MSSNHLILSHPLLLLPSVFPSIQWHTGNICGWNLGSNSAHPPTRPRSWLPLTQGLLGHLCGHVRWNVVFGCVDETLVCVYVGVNI